MNNIFGPLCPVQPGGPSSRRPVALQFMQWGAMVVVCCWGANGCTERDAVSVKLQARGLPQEPRTFVKIEAQVTGLTDGLQYKWFAVSGECEPQASEEPKTVFKFPEGVRQDRVSLEVWRNNKRVAQSEIKLRYDDDQGPREQSHPPDVQIEITNVPPAEQGGSDTHADIAGRVSGKVPPDSMVAIYVRAYGSWYIQPNAHAVHVIQPNNTWETWTHTGSRYAALLVRSDFEPLTRLDMLPQTNGYVLALDIIDGVAKRATNSLTKGFPPQ